MTTNFVLAENDYTNQIHQKRILYQGITIFYKYNANSLMPSSKQVGLFVERRELRWARAEKDTSLHSYKEKHFTSLRVMEEHFTLIMILLENNYFARAISEINLFRLSYAEKNYASLVQSKST